MIHVVKILVEGVTIELDSYNLFDSGTRDSQAFLQTF
jgi:hypothetical protein